MLTIIPTIAFARRITIRVGTTKTKINVPAKPANQPVPVLISYIPYVNEMIRSIRLVIPIIKNGVGEEPLILVHIIVVTQKQTASADKVMAIIAVGIIKSAKNTLAVNIQSITERTVNTTEKISSYGIFVFINHSPKFHFKIRYSQYSRKNYIINNTKENF